MFRPLTWGRVFQIFPVNDHNRQTVPMLIRADIPSAGSTSCSHGTGLIIEKRSPPDLTYAAAFAVCLLFTSYENIVDHCCEAWNKLVDQPWHIMTIGRRKWAHGS
jgi:hypothetical protein